MLTLTEINKTSQCQNMQSHSFIVKFTAVTCTAKT